MVALWHSFPNTATDLVNIQITRPFESGLARVFNSQGVEVRAINLIDQIGSFPTSDLPSGLYILQIQLDGERLMPQSFVVKP
jgi:hypothetical protein